MNAIEENRHNIQANLAAIDAATAAVISKTSGMFREMQWFTITFIRILDTRIIQFIKF